MIACALTLTLALLPQQNRVLVDVVVENQDVYCDIQARDYPVHKVMERLCEELGGRELRGFEDVEDSPSVTVYLKHRPLSQAVDYVLGSVGMTGQVTTSAIHVQNALPPFPDENDTREAARLAFLRALRYFPESAEAPRARMELARIALEQGRPQLAVDHYQLLLEDYPESSLADEARMRAGRLLVELRDWAGAEPLFLEIANREIRPGDTELQPLIGEARREYARCALMRGQARQALFMLRGLESAVPPVDREDRAMRLYLLARAELGVGNSDQCLRYLDQAQRVGRGVIDEFEGMDVRARAMEVAGHPIEAAMAWLHFSRDQSPAVEREALLRAAKLAIGIEGEELAVLFLYRQAEEDGLGEALLPFANEARTRLGLDAETYVGGTPTIRLNRAVQLADAGLADEALALLEGIEPEVWTLPADERRRFALAYAPLLEVGKSVDSAITVLRDVARTLDSIENRKPLYLLAGEIYERHGRFDEAAAAYGGQL